jgi:adenylate kinase
MVALRDDPAQAKGLSMPTYIVLLGPPGAGKGTQAKILAEDLHVPQVSTGDLFRAMNTQNTPFARKVQEIMANGGLVPDDATIQMVKDRLHEPDCAGGAILDGFPRTEAQAEALNIMLAEEFNSGIAVVPFFEISEEEAVRRIAGRWTCPTCGEIYSFDPHDDSKKSCLKDRAELKRRPDDTPDKARERYQVYIEKTSPLIEYYREKQLLAEINAEMPVEDVTRDLLAAIKTRTAG